MATISKTEFTQRCEEFILASDCCRDGWESNLIDLQNCPVVMKKSIHNPKKLPKDVLLYECHIVYSESYANPVLYFNICTMEGKKLSLEECWKIVKSQQPHGFSDDHKWSTVTQQEHPVLHQPFFVLHPCHTSEFMQAFQNNCNYILAWLSVTLPVIGLSIDTDMYFDQFFAGGSSKQL